MEDEAEETELRPERHFGGGESRAGAGSDARKSAKQGHRAEWSRSMIWKPGPAAYKGDTVRQRGTRPSGARGVARCMANRIRMSDGPSDNVRRGADAEIRVKPGGMSGRKLRRRHVPGGEH